MTDERTEAADARARSALPGGEAAGPFETAAVDRRNLEVVLDISVRLSMEVGNTNISIRKLLQLNRGSVVELSRVAESRSTCSSTARWWRTAKSSSSTTSSGFA